VLSDSSSLEELAWGAAGAHPGFRGQLWGSMRSRVWASASLTQTAPAPTANRPLSTVWGPPGGRAPLVGGRVDALQQPAAGQHPHPPAPAATAPGQMLAVQADGGGYPAAGRVDPGQGGVATLTQNEPAPKAAPAGAPPSRSRSPCRSVGRAGRRPWRRRESRPRRRRLRLHPQGRSPRRSLGRRAGRRYRLPWRRRNDLGCRNPPSTQRERNADRKMTTSARRAAATPSLLLRRVVGGGGQAAGVRVTVKPSA
jgi:hypothetical protein